MPVVDLLKEFESLVAAEKAEATRSANNRFHSIIAERAASGTSLSGATIHQLAKVASEEVERFGDTIIKLAEQFASQLKLDSSSTLEVVRIASAQLPLSLIELDVIKNLEEKMGKPSVKLNILRLMDPSRERLKSKLSKLQLGIRDLGGAPVQNFYNHVSAGTIQAGSFQVGQSNSSMGSSLSVDLYQLSSIVEEIEAKIGLGGVDAQAEKELRGDIATIKAQLSKSTPSTSVIAEAAKSLRSVLEGGVGGALATYIPGWITALSVYAGW